MERRGPYNKGKSGHVRNASTYRIFKEHYKKWKNPINGFLALILIFGLAPTVGKDIEASILTTPETTQMIQQDVEASKKSVIEYAHEIIKDCETYRMAACVSDGNALVNEISTKEIDADTLVKKLEEFDDEYASDVAQSACRYDFQNALTEMRNAQKKLDAFGQKYGDQFIVDSFATRSTEVKNSVAAMEVFVKSCGSL